MLIGTTLRNRYKVLEVLGTGGFGDTYLAEDIDLPSHPKCVVKHLKPKDRDPHILPIAKSLFEREAEYLYRLGNSHNQIPKLFAHFEEHGEFFLVEELVEGHSLVEEVPIGQKLSETTVINLLIEILEVLAFVHQNNVIHRDIKLANLMRRHRDRQILLIDFGAVKDVSALATDPQGHTNVTVSIGSPGYMPSEQAMGKPRLSSDVYAVGMIGVQALSGIAPDSLQEDPNTGEILWRKHVQISAEFAEILQNMIYYHFNQRYKSAIEALQAMRSLVVNNVQPNQPNQTNQPNQNYATAAIAPVPIAVPPTLINSPIHHQANISEAPTVQVSPHPYAPINPPSEVCNPTIPWQKALLGLGITLLVSIGTGIAAAFLLPKFTKDQTANNVSSPQAEVTTTPTIEPSFDPTPSLIPPPPTPTIIETPIASTVKPSFGAIARSPSTRYKGYSWNYSNQEDAEERAISECEKANEPEDCEVMVWANNSCISLAEGTNGAAGSARANRPEMAEETAKNVCQQYQGINCTITRTICLPQQP